MPVRPGGESLRSQTDAEAALRLADDVGVAQIAEVEFVDSIGTEDLGVAQRMS